MASQRILTLVAIALLAVLLAWGLFTDRWRRGRPAIVALAVVGALLLLTRRVSVLELALVVTLPLVLLIVSSCRRPSPARRPRTRRRC